MVSTTYAYTALLDILGYRTYVKRDREEGTQCLQYQLRDALSILNDINESELQYQAISDTIIITCSQRNLLGELLSALRLVYIEFLKQGLLIRGGVAYSQHFKSGNLTYSHALTLAYDLESRVAISPRIVIDKNILEIQREAKLDIPQGIVAKQAGVYFLNIIQQETWEDIYNLAKKAYQNDQKNLEENQQAFMKHLWMQSYLLSHPAVPDSTEPYISSVEIF